MHPTFSPLMPLAISIILTNLPTLASTKLLNKAGLSTFDLAKSLRARTRLAGMMDQVQGSAALSLKEYHELVFATPRNHTVFVLFHNAENICPLCRVMREGFQEIAKSYWRGFSSKDDRSRNTRSLQVPVFFVSVNMISIGYQKLKVDLDPSQPSLYVFSPSLSTKYNQFDRADGHYLTTEYGGYDLDGMLKWIQYRAGFYIPMKKQNAPPSSFKIIMLTFICGMFSLFNLYYFGYLETFMEAVSHANYSWLITVSILWLVSGHMFNLIRSTPMMGTGALYQLTTYIYPASRYQYGTESIIIMCFYALMIFSLIYLIEVREHQLEEHLTDSQVHFNVYAGLSGVFFAFMGLQVICNIKS